jgi:fluoride exporter
MCPETRREHDPHAVVDADVDLHDPLQCAETRPHEWELIAAIAAGGVIGAESRYGLGEAIPHTAGQFPWATLIVNTSGCLLIGVLMVLILEVFEPHRMLRPFLGVGVLGGYTTFSTFGVDAAQLIMAHRPLPALGYVVASVLFCLVAVWAGSAATRRVAVRGVVAAPAADDETEPAR